MSDSSSAVRAQRIAEIEARLAKRNDIGFAVRNDIVWLLSELRRVEQDTPQANDYWKLVRVAVELLPDLREWSQPVVFRVAEETDGVLILEMRRVGGDEERT